MRLSTLLRIAKVALPILDDAMCNVYHHRKFYYTVKKRLAVFPSPAGMSLTKLSLGGNNLIFLAQGEFRQ
jgi:hypothetical protein